MRANAVEFARCRQELSDNTGTHERNHNRNGNRADYRGA